MLDAAIAGDRALGEALGGVPVAPGWTVFDGALVRTRDELAEDPRAAEWGTRLFLAPDPRRLVGWGGFKGAPRDGVVELGYSIAPPERERGLATAAVEAMLAEAFADPAVDAVIAHTLAERNASVRVLEKAGFRHEAELAEGDETVWRHRRARSG